MPEAILSQLCMSKEPDAKLYVQAINQHNEQRYEQTPECPSDKHTGTAAIVWGLAASTWLFRLPSQAPSQMKSVPHTRVNARRQRRCTGDTSPHLATLDCCPTVPSHITRHDAHPK